MVDVKRALTFTSTVERMFADQDLTGDLLVLAIALALEPAGSWSQVRDRLGWSHEKLRLVLRSDVERYRPDIGPRVCGAPMIRRPGPCGRPARAMTWWVDPDTGHRTAHHWCSRHADLQDEAARRAAYEAWTAAGSPTPPANAGGVLKRYLSTDWDKVYDWVDPHRRVPGPGGPRAKLTLIRGGADDAQLA